MWNYPFTLHVRLNAGCKIGCQHSHSRTFSYLAQRFSKVLTPRNKWATKVVLVDEIVLICKSNGFAFIHVVDPNDFKNLGLNEMADTGSNHYGIRTMCLISLMRDRSGMREMPRWDGPETMRQHAPVCSTILACSVILVRFFFFLSLFSFLSLSLCINFVH